MLVTGGHDRTVRVWTYPTATPSAGPDGAPNSDRPPLLATLAEGHTADVKCVDINHARTRVVSCAAEEACQIWDVAKAAITHTLTVQHPRSKKPMQFRFCRFVLNQLTAAPVEQLVTVATVGSRGASVLQIWDAVSYKLLRQLELEEHPVCALQLSRDHEFLALATNRSNVRVFSTATWTLAARHLACHEYVFAVSRSVHVFLRGRERGGGGGSEYQLRA